MRMMCVMGLVLAATTSAFAQPVTGGNASCVTVGAATVCSKAECVAVDPYRDPDRAQACMHLFLQTYVPPPPVFRAFQLGAVYTAPYGFQMKVVGLAQTSSGVQVVTCEWVSHWPGDVFSFRNDDNWLSRLFWP